MPRSIFDHQRRCKACSSIFYTRPGHSDEYCETCGPWPQQIDATREQQKQIEWHERLIEND